MAARSIVFALFVASTAFAAAAGDLPDRLTIGYENEGEIDASPKACRETVTDLVEWEEAQMQEAVKMLDFESAAILRDEVAELNARLVRAGKKEAKEKRDQGKGMRAKKQSFE